MPSVFQSWPSCDEPSLAAKNTVLPRSVKVNDPFWVRPGVPCAPLTVLMFLSIPYVVPSVTHGSVPALATTLVAVPNSPMLVACILPTA